MEIIIREVNNQKDIFSIYSDYKKDKDIFLFESSMGKEKDGRYSFIGLNIIKKIVFNNGVLYEDGRIVEKEPFELLSSILKKYKVPRNENNAIPFMGGAMGYIGYDMVRYMEDIKFESMSLVDVPEMYFVFYSNVIIVDHLEQRTYISELVNDGCSPLHIDEIAEKISSCEDVDYVDAINEPIKFNSQFTKQSYMDAVKKMRHYIREGDIYIANMTHTFFAQTERTGYDIYKSLRRVNPSPFGAYMPMDDFEVICSSPERFLNVKSRVVKTCPIKGTKPRSDNPAMDEMMKEALKNSEKDKSELLMVVDLERNDLSKVCQPNSVKVTELFEIESFATVHHLVSTVVGTLEETCDCVNLMKACFPGGSITGTPKVRAIEIIDELERNRRHIYTGSIGYFGFDGDCDFNIVIRTLVKKENKLFLGVGGGITWESEEEAEYNETLDKAGALFEAVALKM